MENEITKPNLIAFEVTRQCKFNCPHCRSSAKIAPNAKELTTEQCKHILKSISQYHKSLLIFTGGEPMERADLLEIINYSRSLGHRNALATCGYLINENSIAKLKDAGIMSLSISLDGANANTHDKFRQAKGAFDAAINAAKLAKQENIKFQINTIISKTNLDEMNSIYQLAKSLGASCFNPFILVPTGKAETMTDALLDPLEYEITLNRLLEIKLASDIEIRVTCGPKFATLENQNNAEKRVKANTGCMGGKNFAFINYKGDIQTCGFLQIPAGNLIEENYDFKKIWENSKLLKEIRDRKNLKGKCKTCKMLQICGGCRARAYTICGDYLASDPFCTNNISDSHK